MKKSEKLKGCDKVYILKLIKSKMKEEDCCPRFNPKKWDKKTFNWKDKKFIKETIPTFFHIPSIKTISKKIEGMGDLIRKSDAAIPKKEDTLILFRDPSAFKSEIYWSVGKKVDGANNITISGRFMAMVFDGPNNAIPKYIKEMEEYLKEKNEKAKDYLVHYAYCPKCAKKFRHNYMILFAKI